MAKINEDTQVTVCRSVEVTRQWTLADLAKATHRPLSEVLAIFRSNAAARDAWLTEHAYAGFVLVPEINTDPPGLDADVWHAQIQY